MKLVTMIRGKKYELHTELEAVNCAGCAFYDIKGGCHLNEECPLSDFSIF